MTYFWKSDVAIQIWIENTRKYILKRILGKTTLNLVFTLKQLGMEKEKPNFLKHNEIWLPENQLLPTQTIKAEVHKN